MAGSSTGFQHRPADVVAVQAVALSSIRWREGLASGPNCSPLSGAGVSARMRVAQMSGGGFADQQLPVLHPEPLRRPPQPDRQDQSCAETESGPLDRGWPTTSASMHQCHGQSDQKSTVSSGKKEMCRSFRPGAWVLSSGLTCPRSRNRLRGSHSEDRRHCFRPSPSAPLPSPEPGR